MAREYKSRDGQEDNNESGLNYQVPETKNTLSGIKDMLRQAHKEEMEEDEKAGKPKKKRPPKQCCYCGDPSCGIGPFTETAQEDVE